MQAQVYERTDLEQSHSRRPRLFPHHNHFDPPQSLRVAAEPLL